MTCSICIIIKYTSKHFFLTHPPTGNESQLQVVTFMGKGIKTHDFEAPSGLNPLSQPLGPFSGHLLRSSFGQLKYAEYSI